MKKSAHQSGQALLIILLVMAVGLTIVLSIVSRTVTDIRVSREQEESARAFSVAEAGIEESLRAGFAKDVTLEGITAKVIEIGQGGGSEFVFEEPVDQGDTQTVWLVEHYSDGNLDPGISYGGSWIEICWGNEATIGDTTPALEATIVYEEWDGFKVFRATFDPNSGRTLINKFGSTNPGSCSVTVDGQTFTFPFKARIEPLPVCILYALRLKLLYNTEAQALGIKGDVSLPTQGKCYESTATVVESGITRKVRQCQSYPAPPAIFDYVLFSGGGLTK